MPKRSSKALRGDLNNTAFNAVQQLTGAADIAAEPTAEAPAAKTISEKNPAAVALGRLGGLKGGKARAEKLSPKKREDIARRAANSRWNKT